MWCRAAGDELVVVARTARCLTEVARQLSVPGTPRIADEHYPDHPAGNGPPVRPVRPPDEAEITFLALGHGAERWLWEACALGAARIRTNMAQALELAALVGGALVDRALAWPRWPGPGGRQTSYTLTWLSPGRTYTRAPEGWMNAPDHRQPFCGQSQNRVRLTASLPEVAEPANARRRTPSRPKLVSRRPSHYTACQRVRTGGQPMRDCEPHALGIRARDDHRVISGGRRRSPVETLRHMRRRRDGATSPTSPKREIALRGSWENRYGASGGFKRLDELYHRWA